MVYRCLVSIGPGDYYALDAREVTVINVASRLKVEGHRDLYRHKREHDSGVGYEPPLDTVPFTVGWVKQCSHTFEEQHDDGPWNNKTNKVSSDRWTRMQGRPGLTIENRADENSSEIGLLPKVATV